jgi:hypothetical protein
MLLDSNIIIYAGRPANRALAEWVKGIVPVVSAVSYVEVLGYHRLPADDEADLRTFFAAASILPVTPPVLERAVRLRQQRKMGLGDAIVAATALEHGHELATRNVDDFRWIDDLTVINPFDELPPPATP